MKTIFLLTAFILAISYGHLKAQDAENTKKGLFEYFYTNSDSIIDLALDTDLRLLVRRKLHEEYQPATFSFSGPDGEELAWDCKVRPRGNIRKSVCYYPPIRLNVKKGDLKSLDLHKSSDKIKVVLQCREGEVNQEYLYREYLIYRMYNLLDSVSYRAQLTTFTFTDPEGKRNPDMLHGFILEPVEDLAERVDGQVVDRTSASSNMMESRSYNVMATFQYMVGNTDWSPANMHNLSTIKVAAERKMHAIPYDFDYSGTVDAFYAIPGEDSPLKSVRERLYNGQALNDAEAHYVINLFNEKKQQLLDICNNFPHMDQRAKNRMLGYLEEFFHLMESPRSAMALLQRK